MKRMMLILGALGLLVIGKSAVSAQTYELHIANQTVTGTELTFDIYMLRMSGSYMWLGTSDFQLTFNAGNFASPTLTIVTSGLTSAYGKSRSLAGNTITVNLNTPSFDEDQLSFETNVVNISAVPPGTLIARLKITGISNGSGSFGLHWVSSTVTAFTPADPWPQVDVSGGASRLDPEDVPLPITIASFGAIISQGDVMLTWKTASEVNNYGFTVQRKGQSETDFKDLEDAFIAGKGTTGEPQTYTFVDRSIASAGTYTYRLKQVDLDGTVHYTESVVVAVTLTDVADVAPRMFQLAQNYPNPFNPSTQVKFSVENTSHAIMKVYNMLGEEVATLFDGIADAGRYYQATFNAQRFASGVYIYRLTTDQRSDVKTMLLVK
jgi:hypothetical protein